MNNYILATKVSPKLYINLQKYRNRDSNLGYCFNSVFHEFVGFRKKNNAERKKTIRFKNINCVQRKYL